jgi:oxazoline/thiazoline synthase
MSTRTPFFEYKLHAEFAAAVSASVSLPVNLNVPAEFRAPQQCFVYGSADTLESARAAAYGEAVERYSLVFQGHESRVWASQSQLSVPHIPLESCLQFSREQYLDRENWNHGPIAFPYIPAPCTPNEAISWSPVFSLKSGQTVLAPTQVCYFYAQSPGERLVAVEDTNGCAAGQTLEMAITNAVLELIERDAIALWWTLRAKRPPFRPDLSPADDQLLASILSEGRSVHFLDLTTDLAIPVIAAISANSHGGALAMGFGAAFHPSLAAGRALREVRQNLNTIHSTPAQHPKHSLPRAFHHWQSHATLTTDPHLLADPSAPQFPTGAIRNFVELVHALYRRDWDVYVLDLSRPEAPLPAARVLCPPLVQPFHRLGSPRLLEHRKPNAPFNPNPFAY